MKEDDENDVCPKQNLIHLYSYGNILFLEESI